MQYIIGSRPDLLGGKLITILNGMRISAKLGRKFLYTWEIQRPELIGNLESIFEESFAEKYDKKTESGFVVGNDFVKSISWSAENEVIKTNGREPTVVLIPERALGVDAYVIDERFSIYLLPGENEDVVRQELTDIFRKLPIARAVLEAVEKSRVGLGETLGVHVRRMDITNYDIRYESMLSFVPVSFISSLLAERSGDETVVVYSDEPAVAGQLRACTPGLNVVSADDMIAADHLNGIQRALADIISLSRSKVIFAGRSAFSSVAAIMGNATLIDIRHATASKSELPSNDKEFYLFDVAQKAMAEGRPADAVTSLEAAIAVTPDNVPCRLDLAIAKSMAGDVAGTERALSECIAAGVNRLDGFSEAILWILGKSRAAMANLNRLDTSNLMHSYETYANKIQNNDVSEAHNDFAHPGNDYPLLSIILPPFSEWLHAGAAERAGELDRVLDHLERAISLAPKWPGLHLYWGRIQRRLGRPGGALTGFYAAAATSGSVLVQYQLSHVLDELGFHGPALEEAWTAFLRGPDKPLIVHHLGNMYARNGKLEDALKYYDLALAQTRRQPVFLLRPVGVLIALGRFEEAKKYTFSALRAGPVEAAAIEDILLRLLGCGAIETAREVFAAADPYVGNYERIMALRERLEVN